MSGTVMTEQAGESREVINKSLAHTSSRNSAKSLTGSDTQCCVPGAGEGSGIRTGWQADGEQPVSAPAAAAAEEEAIPVAGGIRRPDQQD